MMDFVDILITTKGDTRTILGIEAENDERLAKLLLDRYPIEMVAVSYREGDTVWQCLFSAIAVNREKTYTTGTFNIEIVDQVGRGDSFAAGFLYGVIGDNDLQKGLDYGVAFAALKHSFPGDFNWCTRQEVEDLLAGPRPGVNR
jgi:2-dehydro-3-deoxygluconokinase